MDQGTNLTYIENAIVMLDQGLLAVPFVLHSQPTAVFEPEVEAVEATATRTQRRYAEIMRDVEDIVNDHSTIPTTSSSTTDHVQ